MNHEEISKRVAALNLPASVLTKNQKKTVRRDYMQGGKPHAIVAEIRHDDECGNGHNTFAITATLYGPDRIPGETTTKHEPSGKTLWCCGGGCCHEEIAKHFPELAPLIRFHLMDTEQGPMHYVANAVYLAGDRDCHGLRKGEFRQHTSRGPNQNGGVARVPCWELEASDVREIYAAEKPAPVVLEWKPYGRVGEGKARELDSARRVAIWPDATDEQLTAPGLEGRLLARLPALISEFKTAVESLGFKY